VTWHNAYVPLWKLFNSAMTKGHMIEQLSLISFVLLYCHCGACKKERVIGNGDVE
jgi:hypothetical protein